MTLGPGITRTPLPAGFTASGINCGVRKYRPDLGLLVSDRDAVAVGLYTQNRCQAAPVVHCRGLTPSSKIRALVTNSGQANAATGPEGMLTNLRMARAVAERLGVATEQVLTASTGVIGVPLEIEKIEQGMSELVDRVSDAAEPFALAILTTDLVPKTVTTTLALSGGPVRITGICKGSGMIHPNMATMLGFVLTDARIGAEAAGRVLKEATDLSFNMISVDGDTSTNDAVFLLANGASAVPVETAEDLARFREAVTQVSQVLAQAIARDGEGATKLIEVTLEGAPDLQLARRAARGIVVSPLVKSAIHGEDPNWGRILARLGADGVPESCLDRMSLSVQGISLMECGRATSFDRLRVRAELKRDRVRIDLDFGSGACRATAWGCDLSRKYVDINAEYS